MLSVLDVERNDIEGVILSAKLARMTGQIVHPQDSSRNLEVEVVASEITAKAMVSRSERVHHQESEVKME